MAGIRDLFRKDDYLGGMFLKEVATTDKVLGAGSYGSVLEIRTKDTFYAAKKLHNILIHSQNDGKEVLVKKFKQECHLMASVSHPNLTKFIGLCYIKDAQFPLLVMEKMVMDLESLLENVLCLPLSNKLSILHDTCSGLVYLHGLEPPIIHRDLTARNILLTSTLSAKISDLGNSRKTALKPGNLAATLSQCPGTLAYMPPEALDEEHRYGPSLDIFSFGHLSLYTFMQKCPQVLAATYSSPDNPGVINGRSEEERRSSSMKMLMAQLGETHLSLVEVVSLCLQNDPESRPSGAKLMDKLKEAETKLEGKREKSTKELNISIKEGKIQELIVFENSQCPLDARKVQLSKEKEELQKYITQIQERDSEIAILKDTIKIMEERKIVKKRSTLFMEKDFASYKAYRHSYGGTSQPEKLPSSDVSSSTPPTILTPSKLHFIWKKDADLPFATYGAKAVSLDGKLYIGGGDCKDMTTDTAVYEYDVNTVIRKWTAFPSAPVAYFGFEAVNGTLVLIGGLDVNRKSVTSQLTSWDRENQCWMKKLPSMPTARQDCTTAIFKNYLVAGGGIKGRKVIDTVELLDIANEVWHTVNPLPSPNAGMTSCIVNDVWYVVGGAYSWGYPKKSVISLKLDNNIAANEWKTLKKTPLYFSTASAFGEHLMAIGGTDSPTSRIYSSSMFLYSESDDEWKVMDTIPTPRCQATAVAISKGTLVILGGRESVANKGGKTVEILYC